MKIKKVLLIVPPAFTFKSPRDINPLPPIGLGYLASVAEGIGIEVKILDCIVRGWEYEEDVSDRIMRVGLSESEIAAAIGEFSPDIVGVSCQFSRQYQIYHRMFSLVKDVNPECITIAGGAHVSVCPEEVLNEPHCDFILIGEAENSFKDLLMALIKDEDYSRIDGLGWKIDGRMNINSKHAWIDELDSIPFPAYHLMDLDRYFGLKASHGSRHRKRFSPIMSSRGCPARCTFCSAHKVWGKKYRARSVENILEEMRILKEQYGIEELMFEDDNVTANPKRAKELFARMIKENLGFIWDTPNGIGVWSIDEEMLDLMKQSGCIKLNFPYESGSQSVLDQIIKKPLKLGRVKNLIQYSNEIELDYGTFAVIGMPGETKKDIWETFRFAANCGCYDPHVSVATPYPGTELFDVCTKNNFFARPYSLDDLFIRSFMITTPEWTDKELRQMMIKGLLYLNIRALFDNPKYQLRRILEKLKNPRSIIGHFVRIM